MKEQRNLNKLLTRHPPRVKSMTRKDKPIKLLKKEKNYKR